MKCGFYMIIDASGQILISYTNVELVQGALM
jgi:hypothetical protein